MCKAVAILFLSFWITTSFCQNKPQATPANKKAIVKKNAPSSFNESKVSLKSQKLQQSSVKSIKSSRPNELNPQPLPPKQKMSNGDLKALNPQPLPPKQKMSNGNIKALNPQPLPPKAKISNQNKKALNPQPLPSVQDKSLKKSISKPKAN